MTQRKKRIQCLHELQTVPPRRNQKQLIEYLFSNSWLYQRSSDQAEKRYKALLINFLSMNECIKKNVKLLLQVQPDARDNDWLLYNYYRFHFTDLTPELFIESNMSESIKRFRQMLQKEDPSLRGEKYEKRQRHARVVVSKMRSQEKPEDLSYLFNNSMESIGKRIKETRKPWYKKIFN